MKKSFALFLLAVAVAFGLASFEATAQDSSQGKAVENTATRWHGQVVRINTETSTVDVRRAHITRTVHYDSNTKWTKTAGKKVVEISPSEVKDSDSVICLGKFNDKKEFWATRIDLRAGKSAF